MKFVNLGNGLVLIEVGRMLDQVQLAIEPLYGTTYSAETAAKTLTDAIFVSRDTNALRWEQMKDTSQQGMVEFIHCFLSGYYQVWLAYEAWQKNPEYEESANPTLNGDPLRTLMPFPQQVEFDAFMAENIIDRSFRLFRVLKERGVNAVELMEV